MDEYSIIIYSLHVRKRIVERYIREQEEKTMKCVMCKNGDLNEGITTVTLERDATILVFKGVPALVCDQCGESYTDRGITCRLLQIVDEKAQKGTREEFIQYVA